MQVGCRGGGGSRSDHLVSSPLSLPWEHLAPAAFQPPPAPERKGISLPWDQPALQEPEEGTLRVEASLLVSISISALDPFHFFCNESAGLTLAVNCFSNIVLLCYLLVYNLGLAQFIIVFLVF